MLCFIISDLLCNFKYSYFFQYSISNRVIRFEKMVSSLEKVSKTKIVLKIILLEVNLFSVETSTNKCTYNYSILF
jgi:hypothetical protein